MIVLWAALAMLIQDILGVALTQAAARDRAALAACLDTVGWLANIATTFASVDTLQGSNTGRKVLIILAVSAANWVGTYTGTRLGKRFIQGVPNGR